MILPAQEIRRRCGYYREKGQPNAGQWIPGNLARGGDPMIGPFAERTRENGVTYGLSSHGYDVRVAEDVLFRASGPLRMVLASTMEHFCMPDDLCAIVHDKSTWARQGLQVQNTVIEAGWRGFLTLELTWTCPEQWDGGYHCPLHIPAGSGVAQVIFHQLTAPTEQPYEGKYQDQEAGAQAARFDK